MHVDCHDYDGVLISGVETQYALWQRIVNHLVLVACVHTRGLGVSAIEGSGL